MPRAPNEKVKQATELYQKGMKLVEIAQQLQVPAGTVRRWKNTYQWDSERSEKKANVRNEKHDDLHQTNGSRETEFFDQLEKADLTDKQRIFCACYLRTFNATKSYQKAYGCSYETAMVNGSELLRNTKVQKEIRKLKRQRMEQELLTEEDIFQRYVDIAFADITDFVSFGQTEETVMGPFGPIMVKGEDGEKHELKKMVNTIKFKESTEVDGQLISQIKVGKDGASVKLYDKMKALGILIDKFGANKVEQMAEDALTKALKEEAERMEQDADQ